MIIIILIWYPKCSTCKKAKKYLEDNNYNFSLRDIVSETPTKEELTKYYKMSNKELKSLFNTSGLIYRKLNLKDKLSTMSDNEKLDLLAADGMLIKRPLLILKDKVLIGFREKEWSEIIENN